VVEAKAAVEQPGGEAGSAVDRGQGLAQRGGERRAGAAAEARAAIELKKPAIVPEKASRRDEPVDSAPVATVPVQATPAEDISGEGAADPVISNQ